MKKNECGCTLRDDRLDGEASSAPQASVENRDSDMEELFVKQLKESEHNYTADANRWSHEITDLSGQLSRCQEREDKHLKRLMKRLNLL